MSASSAARVVAVGSSVVATLGQQRVLLGGRERRGG
jgi:hypothetical protein